MGCLLEGGFYQSVGEACAGEACAGEARACRLLPWTTWVARSMEFSVCDSAASWIGDAWGRRSSRSFEDTATLGCAILCSPLDPNFPLIAWDRAAG